MASLFSAQPKIIPEFTGLQVNTAVQVLPIPIIYGSPRIDVNLIYYNGFNVQQVSTGSGKGILSGGKGGKETEYFATIILALGEGPLGFITVIYQDQGVYTESDYPSPNFNYFTGTDTQAPWDYVVSTWPDDARSYKDTAYIAVSNAELDASATVPQINIVLAGFLCSTCPLNDSTIVITSGQYDQNNKLISFIGPLLLGYADADPASCIYDMLVNPRYGAGFPAGLLDTGGGSPENLATVPNSLFSTASAFTFTGDAALQTYAQAVGFGWSLVLNNVQSMNSILEQLTKNMTVAPVWTGELLKFIPYWDMPADANPGWGPDNPFQIAQKYFAPNTTPLVSLTLDHLLQAKEQTEDPITFSRVDPMMVKNVVRVDYRDRTNFFNDNVVEAKDEANVELYGEVIDNIGLANEFTLATYANASAQTQLRRNISIRRNFTFRLGPLWAFLDPMDIVQIPDPANWANTIDVRIISCEDDEDEITTYVAEEFPLGAASPTFIPVSPTAPPNQGPTNVPPSPVFRPVIFEPTAAMLTATGFAVPQVIIGAAGGAGGLFDPNWGGANVWISLNNVDYILLGTIVGPSAVGVLTSTLLAYGGANPDTINTLSVSMDESAASLPNFTMPPASLGKSLCVVIDSSGIELLTYTTSVLTGTNQYDLTDLYRGLYGTTSATFNAGSLFLFMGYPTFFEAALPPQYVGSTFWIKLQSFNVFNNATQELSAVTAYQYVVGGGPPPPPQLPSLLVPPRRPRLLPPDLSRPRRRR